MTQHPTGFAPQFNAEAQIRAHLIGAERQPLLVIDQALTNAEQMVAFAASEGRFGPPPRGSLYPGPNGVLPTSYLHGLRLALQPLIEEVFQIRYFNNFRCDGFLGLTTAQAETLSVLQRTPHVDSHDQNTLAIIHYLCGPTFSGTAFYRHATTGFEYIDQTRAQPYHSHLTDELKQRETMPKTFVGADTPFYQTVMSIEAVFNRLVVYRTTSLHCAVMGGATLSEDPRIGRLTANVFIGNPG